MGDNDTEREVIEVLAGEVVYERLSQVEKWGQQDHPSLHSENMRREFAKAEQRWKQINDARVADGTLAWDGILLEEVYEALASEDPLHRREELIQVAAVALAEVESLDRKLAYVEDFLSEQEQDDIEAVELDEISEAGEE